MTAYLIMGAIILVLILVIGILIMALKNQKLKTAKAGAGLSAIRADRDRFYTALQEIEIRRKEANEKHCKIDSADNSDVAGILNDLLCDAPGDSSDV